jgi:thiamine kinase-like enzyme
MKKYGLLLILLTLCSCGPQKIDENYAARVVQKSLALPGPITAQVLTGGFSGAKLFTVTAGTQKYVVRFSKHKPLEDRKHEMSRLKIASDAGYGPHLYYANADEGVLIMEYINHQPITEKQLNSDELYVALARLLQKIHRGPQDKKNTNIFVKIQKKLQLVKEIVEPDHIKDFPLARVEEIIATLHKALALNQPTAPCHNDLNPGNILFLGHDVKAIDFESAAQANPYGDIASVAIFYCLSPKSEHILLSTYLEREPSAQEQAQLYLMKQANLLSRGLSTLAKWCAGKMSIYATVQAPSWVDFSHKYYEGKIDMGKSETRIKYAKSMLNTVITNSQSQEFRDAVKLVEGRP